MPLRITATPDSVEKKALSPAGRSFVVADSDPVANGEEKDQHDSCSYVSHEVIEQVIGVPVSARNVDFVPLVVHRVCGADEQCGRDGGEEYPQEITATCSGHGEPVNRSRSVVFADASGRGLTSQRGGRRTEQSLGVEVSAHQGGYIVVSVLFSQVGSVEGGCPYVGDNEYCERQDRELCGVGELADGEAIVAKEEHLPHHVHVVIEGDSGCIGHFDDEHIQPPRNLSTGMNCCCWGLHCEVVDHSHCTDGEQQTDSDEAEGRKSVWMR